MSTAVNSIIVHTYISRSRLCLHIAWCHLAPGHVQAQCWWIQAMYLWVRFSVGIVKPSVHCLIIPINFNTVSQLYLSRSRFKTLSAYSLVHFGPLGIRGHSVDKFRPHIFECDFLWTFYIEQSSVNIVQTHLSRSRLCLHIAWLHLVPGHLQAQYW